MTQDLLTAIPWGILIAFTFGPVFFVLLETAAIKGARAAIIFDVGVLLADILFLLIAYFSTSTLLEKIKDEPGLFIFGGVILTGYGIINFLTQKKGIPHTPHKGLKKLKKSDSWGLFIKGFLLNFINVGVLFFWLGLIITMGPTMDMDPQRLFLFFTVIIVVYFGMDIFKILLANRLNHKLTATRIYTIKRGISILIFIFGVLLIARGVFPHTLGGLQEQMEIMPTSDSLPAAQ